MDALDFIASNWHYILITLFISTALTVRFITSKNGSVRTTVIMVTIVALLVIGSKAPVYAAVFCMLPFALLLRQGFRSNKKKNSTIDNLASQVESLKESVDVLQGEMSKLQTSLKDTQNMLSINIDKEN